MPEKVIFSLDRIKANKPYGEKSVEIHPVNDVLFELELSDEHFRKDELGNVILNSEGLKTLLNGVTFILYSDEDNF